MSECVLHLICTLSYHPVRECCRKNSAGIESCNSLKVTLRGLLTVNLFCIDCWRGHKRETLLNKVLQDNCRNSDDNCRGFTKGRFSKRVVLADVPPERKPERGYIRMFPRNENRNEGTFACSPGTKNRNEGTFA